MTDACGLFFLGVVLGAVCGFVFTVLTTPTTLLYAQNDYLRCVKDGAPADKCLTIYLMPKEHKP